MYKFVDQYQVNKWIYFLQVHSEWTCWDGEMCKSSWGFSSCQNLYKEAWPSSEAKPTCMKWQESERMKTVMRTLIYCLTKRVWILRYRCTSGWGWSGNSTNCCSCCSRYSPVVWPFKAGRVWWAWDIEQVLGLLTAIIRMNFGWLLLRASMLWLSSNIWIFAGCSDNSRNGGDPIQADCKLGSDRDKDRAIQHVDMEKQGTKSVYITGANDKRQITAVFCGPLVGDFLPIQIIYQGKTPHCYHKYQFLPDSDITHSPKHWSNEETMIEYVEKA